MMFLLGLYFLAVGIYVLFSLSKLCGVVFVIILVLILFIRGSRRE